MNNPVFVYIAVGVITLLAIIVIVLLVRRSRDEHPSPPPSSSSSPSSPSTQAYYDAILKSRNPSTSYPSSSQSPHVPFQSSGEKKHPAPSTALLLLIIGIAFSALFFAGILFFFKMGNAGSGDRIKNIIAPVLGSLVSIVVAVFLILSARNRAKK